MVSNKCVVKGCSNSEKRKYLFPINDLDFAIWVESNGGKMLFICLATAIANVK